MLFEHFQPARSITCNGHGFEVDGRVPVMRLSADQQKDGFEDLVGDGDHGAFMAPSQA